MKICNESNPTGPAAALIARTRALLETIQSLLSGGWRNKLAGCHGLVPSIKSTSGVVAEDPAF
ncbi:MAG: hypothetical protein CM15mP58_13480 [Burkholderiaceae bacterium]|nr:MAG: hypothetical protein CM15mP58_13480 [Burkholderiaceae bacterium]